MERSWGRWQKDAESARAALSAAVSLVLRLLGREADPAKSREHVLLSVLAERRLAKGERADLGSLLDDLAKPPLEEIGALSVAGGDDGFGASELGATVKKLAQRWFVLRNARSNEGTRLLQSRWAMSWMRGPMTRSEICEARALHATGGLAVHR